MLTFRAAGDVGLAAARLMAEHIREATLPPAMMAAAHYYGRTPGLDPADPAALTATATTIRADVDPALAALLGIDPRRPLTPDELAHLLAGTRADGAPIPGREVQRYAPCLADELGLPRDRAPDAAQIAVVLAGTRADTGADLPADQVDRLRRKFMRLYGATDGTDAEAVIAAVGRGRRCDGGPLREAAVLAGLTAARSRGNFIDLTASAPKGLSAAWALAETEAERALLHGAHCKAVAVMMSVVAETLGQVRRGRHGNRGTERAGLVWIQAHHFTARPTVSIQTQDAETGEEYTALSTVKTAGCPQVHSHNLLLLTGLTAKGHVGTPNLDRLAGNIHIWGRLYSGILATELRRLGVAVSLDARTGMARLDAIPEEICVAFSRRTQEGEAAARAYADQQGIVWDDLDGPRRVALLKQGTQGDTRRGKRDDIASIEEWRAEAAALGWTGGTVIDLDRPIPLAPKQERIELACAAAAKILAAEFRVQAVVDEPRARVAAAAGLVATGLADPAEIEEVAALLLARGVPDGDAPTAIVARSAPSRRGRPSVRLTTAAQVAREDRVVTLARDAAADTSGALTAEEVEAGMRDAGLDLSGDHGAQQVAAAQALGRARFAAAVGVAGSGKSALVGGLTRVWQAQGRRVYGVATAWRQARDLIGAGIADPDCLATAAFLARAEAGSLPVSSETVIVLDEAGLAAVADVLALLELRARTGCTLVVIGDPRQGAPVEAGGVFDLARRALGDLPAVTSTIRQRTLPERRLAALAREGETAAVLDALRAENRARLVPGDAAATAEAAATLWWERRAETGTPPLLMTVTNGEARAVAEAVRRRLQAAGEIGADAVEVEAVNAGAEQYQLALAVGDTLRLYGRVYGRGRSGLVGVNGSIVTVAAVGPGGVVLRGATGQDRDVPWDSLRDKASKRLLLGRGLALTLASAQGATSPDAVLVLPNGSGGMSREMFYVALSRHRDFSAILVSEGAERRAIAVRRGRGDRSPIRANDLWASVAAACARSSARETALDLLARAHTVRENAQATLREGSTRLASRARRAMEPTTFPARTRGRSATALLAALHRFTADQSVILAALSAGLAEMREKIRAVLVRVPVEPDATLVRAPRRRRQQGVDTPSPRR